ncbi:hypothetical protein HPP92_018382 [Vanilla planifolia]|uniref:Uncharacterized protein n=1 Tax=Vanilla planifolia TaxID=51239 RepID=A0A835QB10_VANPL|nr:hypothetical protein HPP92_018382 [Vanilla planifolia]
MESMGDLLSALDSPVSSGDSAPRTSSDAVRIAEVKAWLVSQFEAATRDVPEFDYTPRSVSSPCPCHLSQARSRAASIVAADLRLKASEYRAQAARIREILDSVGLSQERLTRVRFPLRSFIVAMGDLSLRKADVDEKRAKVQKDSKVLLEYTRKAIGKLNDLKKTFIKFDNEVPVHEAQMDQWQRNMAIMDSKERQYVLQLNNYKALLGRVGYTSEINHGVLMEMAEHKKDLEKKTKPILDTLRSYQDLPPDKALAALAIERKRKGNMQLLRSTLKKFYILL